VREVRLIGPEGDQVGIVPTSEALAAAEAAEMDLVEIVPTAEPPVLPHHEFRQVHLRAEEAAAAAKKKQKQVQVKEVKFRPGTDEGDYQVKLRNLVRFSRGDKPR